MAADFFLGSFGFWGVVQLVEKWKQKVIAGCWWCGKSLPVSSSFRISMIFPSLFQHD